MVIREQPSVAVEPVGLLEGTEHEPATAGAYSHQILGSLEAIAAERSTWESLVDVRYHGNPFFSLAWHLTWLKHFAGAPAEIRYVKILQGSRTVAYFPLVLRREKFHGVRVRLLRFAGNIYSPVNAPLMADADHQAIAAYFGRRVLPELPWTLFLATDLPPEYPGPSELELALKEAGHRVAAGVSLGNWVYDQPGISSGTYLQQLKYNIRNDTKRFPKKLRALGDLRFRLAGSDLGSDDVAAYQRVYAQSWKEPEIDETFHPAIMREGANQGFLRLGLLWLGDRPIAAQLWLFAQGRGYVVKTAYDEEFRSFSPGTVLTWWIIERLMDDEGMTFFDYLKGDDSYKKYWTNQRRERRTLLAYRRGVAGRSLHVLEQRLLPWLRSQPLLNRWKSQIGRWLGRKA